MIIVEGMIISANTELTVVSNIDSPIMVNPSSNVTVVTPRGSLKTLVP